MEWKDLIGNEKTFKTPFHIKLSKNGDSWCLTDRTEKREIAHFPSNYKDFMENVCQLLNREYL